MRDWGRTVYESRGPGCVQTDLTDGSVSRTPENVTKVFTELEGTA